MLHRNAPRRAMSGVGLGRAKTPERLERVTTSPKLRMAKPGFAAKAAGRRVQKNTIPVRERPIGVFTQPGSRTNFATLGYSERHRKRTPHATKRVSTRAAQDCGCEGNCRGEG